MNGMPALKHAVGLRRVGEMSRENLPRQFRGLRQRLRTGVEASAQAHYEAILSTVIQYVRSQWLGTNSGQPETGAKGISCLPRLTQSKDWT